DGNDGSQDNPPFSTAWNAVNIDPADLAPYVNNGKLYQLDFFDSFGATSWAWTGFDNVRVPGTLASYNQGDTDGDGDIDNTDIGAAFGKFTGPRNTATPVAKPDG